MCSDSALGVFALASDPDLPEDDSRGGTEAGRSPHIRRSDCTVAPVRALTTCCGYACSRTGIQEASNAMEVWCCCGCRYWVLGMGLGVEGVVRVGKWGRGVVECCLRTRGRLQAAGEVSERERRGEKAV